jgi:energy-coupling factor transporter ATP-binding protein EcfA2
MLKKQRVLSLSLRPSQLSELIGQDTLVKSIKSQFDSGRIPHFFIISGPPGSGKTTLARIIVNLLNTRDVREINASNKNGIDDIREVIEGMQYLSTTGSVRVVIFDEAHQITTPAQNALLKETEDTANHVYYIFCTSNISKIIAPLKRRAFILTPEPLKLESVVKLVNHAAKTADFKESTESLIDHVKDMTPGLILQACERVFCGLPLTEGTLDSVENLKICRAVATFRWSEISVALKDVTKHDVIGLKASICGYLKTIMLKNPNMKVAKMIDLISKSSNEDSVCLPSFIAAIYLGVYSP